jgi:hypothetical protein
MSGRVAAHGTGSGGGDGLGRGLREEPAFAAELHAGLEREQRPETALSDRVGFRAGERIGPTASREACGRADGWPGAGQAFG